MNNKISLQVSNLSYRYQQKQIFSPLSFHLETGSFTVLMGANGSGKTTLLKIITCILPLQTGTVQIFNSPLSRHTQQYIGYLPQSLNLYIPHFPVRCSEFLYSSFTSIKKFWRASSSQDSALTAKAIELTQISHLQNKLITDLSGGEKQRLLLARAILKTPKILLLDEPFNHLDYNSQQIIHSNLVQLSQEGTTVLLISHNKEYALEHTKSILFLEKNITTIPPQDLPTILD